jgi:hypothetical protein
MLNKINQKNQFEICFGASCLSYCIVIQVKVIAQEKESEFKISNGSTKLRFM